ncbi:hypothetical protein ACJX0J_012199, partial [Zea mays]
IWSTFDMVTQFFQCHIVHTKRRNKIDTKNVDLCNFVEVQELENFMKMILSLIDEIDDVYICVYLRFPTLPYFPTSRAWKLNAGLVIRKGRFQERIAPRWLDTQGINAALSRVIIAHSCA